jgi:hypothetical protein
MAKAPRDSHDVDAVRDQHAGVRVPERVEANPSAGRGPCRHPASAASAGWVGSVSPRDRWETARRRRRACWRPMASRSSSNPRGWSRSMATADAGKEIVRLPMSDFGPLKRNPRASARPGWCQPRGRRPQMIHAVIERNAPIKGRLRHEIVGTTTSAVARSGQPSAGKRSRTPTPPRRSASYARRVGAMRKTR